MAFNKKKIRFLASLGKHCGVFFLITNLALVGYTAAFPLSQNVMEKLLIGNLLRQSKMKY